MPAMYSRVEGILDKHKVSNSAYLIFHLHNRVEGILDKLEVTNSAYLTVPK